DLPRSADACHHDERIHASRGRNAARARADGDRQLIHCKTVLLCYHSDMDTNHFKQKLEEELSILERDLKDVGSKNSAGEWDPTLKSADIDQSATEWDEVADRGEELITNRAEVERLQARERQVRLALEKIQNGTYGICEISGDKIEEARLEANPAA